MIKVTGTPVEPISITEAKLHLRLTSITEDSSEDTLIVDLIEAARGYCENYTGRSYAAQTLEYYIDAFPVEIDLPRKPVKSVTSIIYKDYEGTETTLTANTDYIVNVDSGKIALPYGKSWPTFTPYPLNPIKITYLTGDAGVFPSPVKAAMLLLIGHWYANREAGGSVSSEVVFSVRSLLDQYRDRWWD